MYHCEGRSVEHLKKELQQKGDIGLVAEVLYSVLSLCTVHVKFDLNLDFIYKNLY